MWKFIVPVLLLVACGGTADESCDRSTIITWPDADGDGYGLTTSPEESCGVPAGRVSQAGDCDDADALVNVSAPEICDGIDQNCNDVVDEGLPTQTWYADGDGDGFGGEALHDQCAQPQGHISTGGDCDDSNATIFPAAQEICDGQDNNCDGLIDDADPTTDVTTMTTWHTDSDLDGFGDPARTQQACEAPVGSVADGTDCRDSEPDVNPSATEVCGGGDEDCDGLSDDADDSLDLGSAPVWFVDADGDGLGDPYATLQQCLPGPGVVDNADDCDDSDATATVLQDWLTDDDGDGYGAGYSLGLYCNSPGPYTAPSSAGVDCDDADALVNPGQSEITFDGIDNDCNPLTSDICTLLCEDFEDGDISDWTMTGFSGGVPSMDYTTAADNTAVSLKLTGSAFTHFDGVSYTFNNEQPSTISFWVRSSGTQDYRGYFVFGEANLYYSGIAAFFLIDGNQLMLVDGNYAYNYAPYTPLTWHFVELDLDWNAQTMDFRTDGVTRGSNLPFLTPTNHLAELQLYNFTGQESWFDQITVMQ